ncbi:hypothetical protein NMG60_11000579 [Bertholletia excelsa]
MTLLLLVGVTKFFFPQTDPVIRETEEFDSSSLIDLLPEIPFWVKHSDYDRVDWLNKFIHNMWPHLEKAIRGQIQSMARPIFAEYIGKFQINDIGFESLSLGTLPPVIHGIKVYESNEKELVLDPAVKWAGNPNITLVLRVSFLRITVQLVDLQKFAEPRIVLKPFVPTFPCFASIMVSLMEKPHIDFGLKVIGGDVMAIPGFYQFVQEVMRKQVARLYLWPQALEVPILDSSDGAVKKPVGILHVKVLRACKLLKKDLIGTSDPYVQLNLGGEMLPAKKSSIRMNNLNPIWNEDFKFIVKDPDSQILQLQLYDWEKFGAHDKLGMQVIPLKWITPYETKEFKLDLLHSTKPDDPHNMNPRGQVTVETTFIPFQEENQKFILSFSGAGLLLVTVVGAKDGEGKRHNNPYGLVLFKGEKRKTKRGFGFRLKESLGHVDINLIDVVNNGCINEKYHLINSKHGVIHLDIRLKAI